MSAMDRLFEQMNAAENRADQSFKEFLDHVDAPESAKQQACNLWRASMPPIRGVSACIPLIKSNTADEQIDGDRQFRFGARLPSPGGNHRRPPELSRATPDRGQRHRLEAR